MKPEARTAKMAIETARAGRPAPTADPPTPAKVAAGVATAVNRMVAQKVIDDNQPARGDAT